jgi:hypothetical protein
VSCFNTTMLTPSPAQRTRHLNGHFRHVSVEHEAVVDLIFFRSKRLKRYLLKEAMVVAASRSSTVKGGSVLVSQWDASAGPGRNRGTVMDYLVIRKIQYGGDDGVTDD